MDRIYQNPRAGNLWFRRAAGAGAQFVMVSAHGVFTAISKPPAHASLRAVICKETRLTWHAG
jgi:hypothetical protein